MIVKRQFSVLVVDDAEGVRESLCATLESEGHEVVALSSGREGVAALDERKFDAMVADLWMREVNGVELLKYAHRYYPEMLLIAMTGGGPGMSIETASLLAQSWKAERVFVKPFDELELLAFLSQRLQKD